MPSLDPFRSPDAFDAYLDRHPHCISPDTPLSEVLPWLASPTRQSSEPLCVTEDDRLLGFVSATDALVVLADPTADRNVPIRHLIRPVERTATPDDLNHFDRLLELSLDRETLPLIEPDGRLAGLISRSRLLRAFSEQRRERTLLDLKFQTSEQQLRRMLEAMADVVLVVDASGNSIKIAPTQAVLEDSSQTNPRLIDRTIDRFLHPETSQRFLEPVRRALQTQQIVSFEYSLSVDTHPLWFAANISPMPESNTAIWVARDITERKNIEKALADLTEQLERHVDERTEQLRAANEQLQREIAERQDIEAALHQSEERFEIALKNSPISVFTKNAELRYTWAYNPPPGLDAETLVGKCNAEVFTRDDARRLTDIEQQVLASKSGTREEICLVLNGNFRYYDLTVEPLYDPSGAVRGIVCASMDVTDRKLTEEALKTLNQELETIVEERTAQIQETNTQLLQALSAEQELNELKSRFVTMTSHEFRTPLTTILGSAELLKHYGNKWSDEKKQSYLDRIYTTVAHMTRLLDDVLTVSKAETGQLGFSPSPVNLKALCETLIDGCSVSDDRQHSVKFRHRGPCDGSSHALELDARLLRQILANLLSNAMKYSQAGTSIDFEVVCQNDRVAFQIRDRGIGIPADDRKHLFESFHRGKNVGNIQGTGLGLSIVKKSVDLHGGDIQIDSEEGRGTTVTVTIPLRQERQS
ncbi:ATP-binding protein [Baaleninema simplex]|uniref:ATP-binding protein n=1 Tax=Baaleninema simplex TaxID=2862350 RepID=UPI000364380E|nr:ATP-binding protein [Baaleninema simplex]